MSNDRFALAYQKLHSAIFVTQITLSTQFGAEVGQNCDAGRSWDSVSPGVREYTPSKGCCECPDMTVWVRARYAGGLEDLRKAAVSTIQLPVQARVAQKYCL